MCLQDEPKDCDDVDDDGDGDGDEDECYTEMGITHEPNNTDVE